jgi:hypothetical protein
MNDVGDVRRLAGRVIEIHGPAKLYDGRAEIILNRVSQLTGRLNPDSPMPKDCDVEKQGHYSAGPHAPHREAREHQSHVNPNQTFGNEADVENNVPQ